MMLHPAARRHPRGALFVLCLLLAGSLLLGLGAVTHTATTYAANLPAAPPPPEANAPAAAEAAPGRLVIGVPPGLDAAAVQRLASRHGATVERWLPRLGLALLRVPVGTERATQVALAPEDTVDFVGEHRPLARIADTPGDEYWDQQWGPVKIQTPAAWDLAWGHPSIAIAVIDTGVNYLHADLESQMWYNPGESALDPLTGLRSCNTPLAFNGEDDDGNGYVDDCRGYDFVDPRDNNPLDEHASGHGTFVAGIAAAAVNNPDTQAPDDFEGVAGVGRNSRIMALRTLNQNGAGYTLDIAEAIDYAAANGAQVINLSLTYPPTLSDTSNDAEMLRRAIGFAQAQGALVVAASGNEGYPGVSYPAKVAGVVAVGASTTSDNRANFSNYGARLDLVAPGVGIYGVLRQPGTRTYGYYAGDPGSSSGTSFAAPHAAGVAALIRALRPDLSEAAVYDLLRQTADDVGAAGFDTLTGWGRLNAARAVSASIPGLNLAVNTDTGVGISGRTTVRVRVTDPEGRAAGLGARVTLSGTRGTLMPATVTLDDQGTATAQFTAGPEPGPAHIIATLGVLSATAPLTITSGVPVTLTLDATPVPVITNGMSTITATVRDEGGNPVMSSLYVTFTATLGTLDPASTLTAEGQAGTIFTAGMASGVALIEAQAARFTATLALPIVGPGEPFTVTLDAEPAVTLVNGASVQITAQVVDAFGDPVSDGIPIQFATDLGALSAPSDLTLGGQAEVVLTPGTQAGGAHISAQAGNVQGSLTVPILAGPAATLALSTQPIELTVGYNQIARLAATAADQYGNPVTDGTLVQFATTLGQLAVTSAATSGGKAEVDLIGGVVAGEAQVTATAPGGAEGRATVTIRPAASAAIALAAMPAEITVGGGVSRLQVTVRDAYDNLVADGTVVTVTADLGGLRPVADAGLAPVRTLAVQTVEGVAQADLVSGDMAGSATVRAAIAPEVYDTISVTFRPGAPVSLTLAVNPAQIRAGGRVELSAWVTDGFGNPVQDGTAVNFAASSGYLSQALVPTSDGAALTRLTAPLQPGPVQVVAVSGDASDFETVTVEEGPPLPMVFLPLVLR
jgi:subtilisin family serine protease